MLNALLRPWLRTIQRIIRKRSGIALTYNEDIKEVNNLNQVGSAPELEEFKEQEQVETGLSETLFAEKVHLKCFCSILLENPDIRGIISIRNMGSIFVFLAKKTVHINLSPG